MYSELWQTSKMERFTKIVNGFQPLTIFSKRSILDVWQGFDTPLDFVLSVISVLNFYYHIT